MSHIIELLEATGRGETAVGNGAGLGFSLEQQAAIAAGDVAEVTRLFAITVTRACYVTAPDNDPVPAESPENVPDDVPDEPDRQDSEAA